MTVAVTVVVNSLQRFASVVSAVTTERGKVAFMGLGKLSGKELFKTGTLHLNDQKAQELYIPAGNETVLE